MRVIRVHQTQVDITDMNKLFSGDIAEIVLSQLKQQYVGKCRFGCMILNILSVDSSACRIDPESIIGQGYVNVSFTAEVLELAINECVITKIIEIQPQNIILTQNDEQNIVTFLKRNSVLKIVQVGNYIPVRVLSSQFTPGKSKITVNSALYTLPKDSYIFQIDPLNASEKEELEPLMIDIKELTKKLKKIDSKLVKFFNEMLYPFSNKPTLKSVENMMDLSSSGLVCRHHTIDKLTPSIMVYKKTEEPIQIQPAIKVYESFLNDYKNHMLTIIYLCDHFHEPELRKQHENIWQIYKKNKTPI